MATLVSFIIISFLKVFFKLTGPFGELDLSRPDSINQQTPTKLQKVQKLKPKQNLAFGGHMDLSRPDNINQQNPIWSVRARSVLAKRSDSLGIIEAQHNTDTYSTLVMG